MNRALDRLAELVCAPVDQLIDALYVLRAPSSLVGIVPMARQFRDWRRDCVGLASCPELPDYTLRLALLDRIADLDVDDPDLMGLVIRRIKSKWKPLYPLTGDSVIGELLLIRGSRASNVPALEQVSVWLLWVAQRFHIDQVTRDTYVQYLNSDSHRLVAKTGRRLYGAYLALRNLAAPTDDARRHLDVLSELVGSPSLERCLELTLLARLARLRAHSPDRRALRRYALERLGCSELELNIQIEHAHRVLPAEFALLLVTVWRGAIRASAGLGGGGRLHGVTIDRPSIRYGERLTEILARADEDDVHAGTVVDFFSHDEQAPEGSERADPDDDDADDEDPQDPAFSLFLADANNPIVAYYAAKSIQNAIEYQNAQLRWSNSTLTHAAVALVVQQVAAPGADVANCAPLGERARLAIGLSLMTGRALDEVARPCITVGEPPIGDKEPVGISLDEHRLYIRAGRPELKHPAKIKPAFCNAVDKVLSIPLPEAWMPLVAAVGTRRLRSARPVIRDARRQLHNFEHTFHITEKGIRYALIRALAERTAGDLGLQKVITDGVEADSRNVVHYASYRSSQVETWWREAAETLVGHLPDTPKRSAANYVGSQHPFDLDQLAAYFGEIKRRIAEAERNQDWPRLFNRMTLYLSYWLGLGLAHRKSLKPVPRILLEDQWVVVADKHRHGGSTDRLVPLTRALRDQIDIYVSLASELSITISALEPVIATEQGNEIRLQYIRPTTQPRRKDVVPYQPKYQEQDEQLTSLPANWGRKVVRSASTTLPGRYRDAELGHWVRGRHAWDTTSTFNAGDFHERWLELQRTFEKRLGFEVLSVAGCESGIRRAWQPRAAVRIRDTEGSQLKTPAPTVKDAEVKALLRIAGEQGFADLIASKSVPSRAVALELALRTMRTQHAETIDRQREVAIAVCAWMREKWQVPIFAVKPRLLFANKVVLNAGAIQTLGFLQRHLLAPFLEDLACLPPEATGPTAGVVADRAQIELGRLVMIGIWRLGLASWGLVESWLHALHDGAPILAQGPNRYLVLQVRTSASREVMMRTVFLDDFSSAYLAVERQEICRNLLPSLFLTTANKDGVQKDTPISARRRRSKVEAGLRAYVRHLGVKSAEVPFAAMVAAAAQWIMLHSAPMIASYARGGLDTTDLGDAEIRRLGGLTLFRRGSTAPDEVQFPVTQRLDLGDADLPADLLARVPVMRALGCHRSPHKGEWRRIIRQYKPTSAVERLLCSFALWLLDHSDPKAATESRISAHRKLHLAARIKIVAYALLGYVAGGTERFLLDADALASLQEASREQFPDRLQHGAWFHFYSFLKDGDADHAGFEVGKLGPPPERAVSAKILTAGELDVLHSLLWSARSGIGNPALRISAQRHVELMAAYGLRRAESAYLRSVDFQQDAARVQAYGQHSLKTPWADRVLPIAFADPSIRTWVRKATDGHFEKLIDSDAKTTVHPDNFFDALSRLVKAVTQDDSMGSHHLRHTLISRLVLTLLRDSAGLDALGDDLPWLRGLILDRERMRALLGAEGDAGQGMRAVSALVGHSHPTTTIRHYVHVLGISLYGTLRKVDTLDMSRSFENRLGGKSTVQRWAAQARFDVVDVSDVGERRQRINRVLRDRIERRFHDAGVDRDETPRPVFTFSVDGLGPDDESAEITFDKLELVDRSLRDAGDWLDSANIAVYQQGLARLASVLTGRRGSTLSRHVLTEEREGVWLPRIVSAGVATRAAVVLCKWLESLRVHRPEDFQWLLTKWVCASARERGRGRVDTTGEVERARGLGDNRYVEVRIERAFVSKKRRSQGVKRVPRLRIKCLDGARKPMTRATIATRWVMSYVAARWYRW